MRARCEEVGEAQEEGEEGEGSGVGFGGGGGREAEGEVEAFARGGVVESVSGKGEGFSGWVALAGGGETGAGGTYFSGLSAGWSVTMRCSNASPACSIALMSSGVRSVSVTSALSLMTVAQGGSLGWSLVLVREMS